ncbi:MAG: 2Fe-2S iron-sulfur cluster-binding protein [Rubrivivax sp.]
MPRITFIEHGGAAHVVTARAGDSLMRAAIQHGVPGIMADCAGQMTCGTCHGYIDERWPRAANGRGADETALIEAAGQLRTSSRLTCQVRVEAWMDGMVVQLPASQY